MIGDLRVLGLIPARGGSKRVPGKNLRMLAGKPLLHWTVAAAKASAYVDKLVLSSEDPEIQRVAAALGCEVPFTRPAHLAGDDAAGIDVVLHAIEAVPGFDLIVLLQPTSPLRIAADIDRSIERCARGAQVCVSVSPVNKNLAWMYRIGAEDRLAPYFDSLSPAAGGEPFLINGAVYAARVPWLMANRTFVTPETVAHAMPFTRGIDIDTEEELSLAGALLECASVPHR